MTAQDVYIAYIATYTVVSALFLKIRLEVHRTISYTWREIQIHVVGIKIIEI